MKAVVLEIRKKEAAVLCKDGRIIRIPEKDFAVGDEIEVSVSIEKDSRRAETLHRIRQSCAAAAAVAVILGFGGSHWYQTAMACSYVSLDINPSIEYTLNRQNCVLDVTAVNDDAEEIVSELKEDGIKKCTLTEALEKTAELLEEKGYLTSDETGYVLIDVSSDDKSKTKALKKEASVVFAEMNEKEEASVEVTVTQTTVSQRKEARELGISSGEYQQIRSIEGQENNGKAELSPETVKSYEDWNVRDFLHASGALPEEEGAAADAQAKSGDGGSAKESGNSSPSKSQGSSAKSQSSSQAEAQNGSSVKSQGSSQTEAQNSSQTGTQNGSSAKSQSNSQAQAQNGSQTETQNGSSAKSQSNSQAASESSSAQATQNNSASTGNQKSSGSTDAQSNTPKSSDSSAAQSSTQTPSGNTGAAQNSPDTNTRNDSSKASGNNTENHSQESSGTAAENGVQNANGNANTQNSADTPSDNINTQNNSSADSPSGNSRDASDAQHANPISAQNVSAPQPEYSGNS